MVACVWLELLLHVNYLCNLLSLTHFKQQSALHLKCYGFKSWRREWRTLL